MIRGLTQFVFISDLHIGSTLALSPSKFKLPEGNWFHPSKSQQIINKFWDCFWDRRWSEKVQTIVCLGGEAIDSVHHNSLQLWVSDETSMIDAAVSILSPIATKAHRFFWVGGTAAHSGSNSRWDRTVMNELGVKTLTGLVEYRNRVVISDVCFDLAHHGPMPSRKVWITENGVRSYAKNIMLRCLSEGKTPPDVIIRGHVHVPNYQEVSIGRYKTHMIISPSWQWKSEFAYKIDSESDIVSVGGVVAMVKDGVVRSIEIDSFEFDSVKDIILN